MSQAKTSPHGVVFRLLGKVASVRATSPTSDSSEGEFACYLRGRLFDQTSSRWKNQIAVGDEVDFEILEGEPTKAIITRIHDRRTSLVRKLSEKKGRLQLLAANVDQIVIVSAIRSPPYRLGLIERYLAIAHYGNIAPAICINKMDSAEEDDRRRLDRDMAIYRELGYPVLLTSAKFGLGLEELQSVLRDKRSVLVGHSGVGKSKLAVAIEPSARLMSSELDRRGRGRHTTTASLLVPIEGGGELVDTPGIRELGIQHIPAEELADCYPSMRPFLSTCRFHPCSHVHEPDCAIKRAAREGQIPEIRYQSYVRLYEEITGSS